MRLIVTSDLHYNHPRSKPLAEQIIAQINETAGDVLLVVGDTASFDGEHFERCLAQIRFAGPRLITAGNHELWTNSPDSHAVYTDLLPARARNLGWQWLEDEPFVAGDVAIVGSIGWYDYSFAQGDLGIPRRFYESKISPGAAERYTEFSHLFDRRDDLSEHAMQIVARWNDGRFVKLRRSDGHFLDELLLKLRSQLDVLRDKRIIAAIHHLPFRQLLPPPKSPQWDFAKAYLGSEKIGELLLEYPNVQRVICGHSHFPAQARVGHIEALATGCGYRAKSLKIIDV